MKIIGECNRHIPYLYNLMIDIIRKNKLQAQITPKEINLPVIPDSIVKELEGLNIKLERG